MSDLRKRLDALLWLLRGLSVIVIVGLYGVKEPTGNEWADLAIGAFQFSAFCFGVVCMMRGVVLAGEIP